MKIFISAILTIIFTVIGLGQNTDDKIIEVNLSKSKKTIFFMDETSYDVPHFYILRLKKGQKAEIENGWLETPRGFKDFRGEIDNKAAGFQVIFPNGSVISADETMSQNRGKYLLKATKTGIYKIRVAPIYKTLNERYLRKERGVNYNYKIFFTLK